MQTEREGVKKSKTFVDVVYGTFTLFAREIWREEVFSLEQRRQDAEGERKNLCGRLWRLAPFPFIAFLEFSG